MLAALIAALSMAQALCVATAAAWWCITLRLSWMRASREAVRLANDSPCADDTDGGRSGGAPAERTPGDLGEPGTSAQVGRASLASASVRVSIFKPIPDRHGAPLSAHSRRAIASFARQLREDDEMLLAVSAADEPVWRVELLSGALHVGLPNGADATGGSCGQTQIHVPVRLLHRPAASPSELPNPKVECLRHMAGHARGRLWLWSDADVVAPPGLVEEAIRVVDGGAGKSGRGDGEGPGVGVRTDMPAAVEVASADSPSAAATDADAMARRDALRRPAAVTVPYRVRTVPSAPAVLDALYVNAELLPGLRLIAATSSASISSVDSAASSTACPQPGATRWGSAPFALGAFAMFRAEEFQNRADWQRIGAGLADDYELGQALRPVALPGHLLVEIAAEEPGWRAAILHYYRWQKNIRWCQPTAYAAQLAVTPGAVALLSLAIFAILAAMLAATFAIARQIPNLPFPSAVFAAPAAPAIIPAISATLLLLLQLTLLESAWALLLCRAVHCRTAWRGITAPLWSLARAATWLAVWLPIPVRWGRRIWHGPRTPGNTSAAHDKPPP
ncbi:hypothetical protein DB346_18520 [Verrucomicrobia bacterium LW23]|nr:hypothetical protein DB346_18520 [Verrucomicrobia bacterium LW23]